MTRLLSPKSSEIRHFCFGMIIVVCLGHAWDFSSGMIAVLFLIRTSVFLGEVLSSQNEKPQKKANTNGAPSIVARVKFTRKFGMLTDNSARLRSSTGALLVNPTTATPNFGGTTQHRSHEAASAAGAGCVNTFHDRGDFFFVWLFLLLFFLKNGTP